MKGNEFWSNFYESLARALFSNRVYVLKAIVDEPKTMREISNETGIPYMTVRKYIRSMEKEGLVASVGVKKVEGALAETWTTTFVPEVVDVVEDLAVKITLKLYFKEVFCERVCPYGNGCSSRVENRPKFRVVEVEVGKASETGGESC